MIVAKLTFNILLIDADCPCNLMLRFHDNPKLEKHGTTEDEKVLVLLQARITTQSLIRQIALCAQCICSCKSTMLHTDQYTLHGSNRMLGSAVAYLDVY